MLADQGVKQQGDNSQRGFDILHSKFEQLICTHCEDAELLKLPSPTPRELLYAHSDIYCAGSEG